MGWNGRKSDLGEHQMIAFFWGESGSVDTNWGHTFSIYLWLLSTNGYLKTYNMNFKDSQNTPRNFKEVKRYYFRKDDLGRLDRRLPVSVWKNNPMSNMILRDMVALEELVDPLFLADNGTTHEGSDFPLRPSFIYKKICFP